MDRTVPLALSTAANQPRSAGAVIIGGGIIGVSIAWHLAKSGVKDIVVVERSEMGSGSSAKPLGGVRANFSDPSNIELGRRSLHAFDRFSADFGVDIGLEKVGYLFLARDEAQLSGMTEAVQVQNGMGISSRLVTPEEAHRLNPFIDPGALTGASYSPDDGFVQPTRVVEGYVRAAQELGVTFLNRTQVLDITTSAGQVSSVLTQRGEIATDAVVCCAGAWSAHIGEMVGVSLPIEPVRRLIGFTPDWAEPLPTVPFTLDLTTTMYFHNAGRGLLLGISHHEDPSMCRDYSYEWLEAFREASTVCAPALSETEVTRGWAGLYENTPDRNAVIGQARETAGFFYAAGFSGHGLVQAPAVGELMADLFAGRRSFIDATPFSAERFEEGGAVLKETNII
ncbi:NAD(P)/FAD-dependent oxidoreductase [Nesterenkonia natronophila]|uniref:FAD-binding oxidoreductase n=1 Tax=Nesterenkonia natronophila TaxID=2174932 RepID=A0A3A4F5F9_9MICC|nr:FAD-binding oxidoreductase [Nesterenkonia natronophila]RJN32981.1 FAD-binding oxidoreductase [Nesterenkonia natronophila]